MGKRPEDEKTWYEETASEEDRLYDESVEKVLTGVRGSLTFEQAAGLIEVKEASIRAAILDDALKVLLAEMHFAGKKPLKEVAQALGLPIKRLEKARAEMLREVEQAAIEKYKSSMGQTGNA
jgi:hypothetical protein